MKHEIVKVTTDALPGDFLAVWYSTRIHCSCGESVTGATPDVAQSRFDSHRSAA